MIHGMDFDYHIASVQQELDAALSAVPEGGPLRHLAVAVEDLLGAVKVLAEHSSMPREVPER